MWEQSFTTVFRVVSFVVVSNWDDRKFDVAVALAVATRIKIRARPFVSEFRLAGSEWRMETQRSAYMVVLQVVWIKPASPLMSGVKIREMRRKT